MTPRALLGGLFASIGILVIGWEAGANAATTTSTLGLGTTGTIGSTSTPTPTPTPTGTSTPTPTATASATPTPTPTATPTATTATSSSDGTWKGQAVQTPFGNMQVAVTISGGKITDVQALQITGPDFRSQQISNYAVPILRNEVLQAQTYNVQMVGGATYSSYGYLKSLQSALDQAGF